MPKLIDLLPATRAEKHRSIAWEACEAEAGCACVGVLTVSKGKRDTRYAVVETYASPNYGAGRVFQLVKADGTRYNLFLADDRPHSTCDCPGCSYQNTERADRKHGDRFETLGCCHLDAMDSIVNYNRWLADPRENPGADVGATEVDEQEESLASAEAASYDAMCEAADQRAVEADRANDQTWIQGDDEYPF